MASNSMLRCRQLLCRAHIVAHLPGLQMLDGRAVGPEESQQAVQALRHQAVLMALMLTNACLVHKLVRTQRLTNMDQA